MDTPEEAVDYDQMDHSGVNRLFVDHLIQAALLADVGFAPKGPATGAAGPARSVLDVGTGTAQIPIELARRDVACRIVAIDLAQHMLDVGARNVAAAGLTGAIRLEIVVAALAVLIDELRDGVPPVETVGINLDPQLREVVEVGPALPDLFFL